MAASMSPARSRCASGTTLRRWVPVAVVAAPVYSATSVMRGVEGPLVLPDRDRLLPLSGALSGTTSVARATPSAAASAITNTPPRRVFRPPPPPPPPPPTVAMQLPPPPLAAAAPQLAHSPATPCAPHRGQEARAGEVWAAMLMEQLALLPTLRAVTLPVTLVPVSLLLPLVDPLGTLVRTPGAAARHMGSSSHSAGGTATYRANPCGAQYSCVAGSAVVMSSTVTILHSVGTSSSISLRSSAPFSSARGGGVGGGGVARRGWRGSAHKSPAGGARTYGSRRFWTWAAAARGAGGRGAW